VEPDLHYVDAQIGEVTREATLLSRFRALLDEMRPERRFGERDKIAIKLHVGGPDSYTTVHPQFVRVITERFVKRPNFLFVVDEHRATRTAYQRGYTRETLGAPVYPISGVVDRYHEVRQIEDSEYFDTISVAGNGAHADGLIVISHAKGHASCGFGGAIKNIGIGCVAQETRNHIHTFERHDAWREDVCSGGDEPHTALQASPDAGRAFSEALARSAVEVVRSFPPPKVLCLNVALNVHPYCDCWGLSSPSILPDIGLVIGSDPADVDAATLERFDAATVVEPALPEFLTVEPREATESGHILERIHGKNPWIQVDTFRKLTAGTNR
jgi:uncharacterized Fe-S center protein